MCLVRQRVRKIREKSQLEYFYISFLSLMYGGVIAVFEKLDENEPKQKKKERKKKGLVKVFS